MSSPVASPVFVGRARELAQLVELARAAAGDEPAFVLIGGESGVGKSRLVAEFTAQVADHARVLSGDCVDIGGAALPYGALVAALRGIESEELARHLGQGARELAPLLPQLAGDETTLAAGPQAQGRLFELLLALLAGLGADRPLALIIEDVHWADPSTRDFLTFLFRNRRRERLMAVVTYRTDELHRRHPLRPLLAEADRARTAMRLTLDRFTREEMVEQLAGILGHAPPARLVDELFVRAEGNPFFTEELLAASGDHGEARLPEDIRDSLMLRIEGLSADAQTVLRVAAAAGVAVRHALLAAAAPLEHEALLTGVREAVAHHILVQQPSDDVYRFRHALLREAIADDLLPGERGPLHAALGHALSGDPSLSVSGRGVAAELAFHWSAAHDLSAAFAASAQAGAEAERMAAFAEANTHFERAAELWDAVPVDQRQASPSRMELLLRAAEAAHLSGDGTRALALARSALALVDAGADPLAAANLHERICRFLWVGGLAHDALEELELAVELMPADAPPANLARVLSAEGHLLLLTGQVVKARERCEAALALARQADARREECRILNTLGAAQTVSADVEDGIAHLRRALALARQIPDPEEIFRACINLAEALDRNGRLDEAVEISREGIAVVRRERTTAPLPILIAELALRLIRLGRWREADEVLPEALATPEAWGVGVSGALVATAQLRALRGDRAGTEEALARAERTEQTIGSMRTAPSTAARAEAALWTGDPEHARAVVEAELERVDPADEIAPQYLAPVIPIGVRAEADLASRARATGDAVAEADAIRRAESIHRRGRELLGLNPGWEAQFYVTGAEAELDRARGTVTAETWPAAVAQWEQIGNLYMAAYARWRHAEASLERTGARGDASTALADARITAAELGATPLLTEIDGLARRARIDLRGQAVSEAPESEPTAADRVGLTARELDVLTLMAQGLTNREIAGALYISQKTVTVHVSRILAKLDARSRVEAAGLAQRLGLVELEPHAQSGRTWRPIAVSPPPKTGA